MIVGDNDLLTGARAWMQIIIVGDEVLVFYGDDLVCSFSLFEMPRAWWGLFAFSKTVPGSVFGKPWVNVQ